MRFEAEYRFRDAESYTLRSVIVHHGVSPVSGHYVCHVRHEDKWFTFDDEMPPVEIALEQVLQCQAYMLFYEKQ